MKYAWLVLAVYGARFYVMAIDYPEIDGDLAWQRWLGGRILAAHAIPRNLGLETFTAAGTPWLPHEWLFSLAASAAEGGIPWAIFATGIALAAFGALALAARRAVVLGASARATAVCTALAGITLFSSFGVRAQVAAWFFLALVVLALEADGPWCYAVIPITALWSNVHASAVLAPVVALLFTVGTGLEERSYRSARVRRAAVVTGACAAAVCFNPFGIHLPLYAFSLLGNPIKTFIAEWKVTDLAVPSFRYGALPLVCLALLTFGKARLRTRDALMFSAFLFLMLSAARNVALFGLVSLPLVALALTRVVPWLDLERPAPHGERLAKFAMPAISLALASIVAVGLLRGQGRSEVTLPRAAFALLLRTSGPHRLLCQNFAWCGAALGMPNVRVFLDGRADPYPPAVWSDYIAIVRLQRNWQRTLDARGADALVVAKDAPLDQAIAQLPGWRLRYADKTYRLWLRCRARDCTALKPDRAPARVADIPHTHRAALRPEGGP